MNVSRSRIPHPYAKSATDKNLRDNASSKNPNTTFTELSHPPDFGMDLSIEGNIAKIENGNANASAKPNIPIAGPNIEPCAASTKRVPIIGPVHENDTSTKVNAINNIERNPVVLSAFASIFDDHDAGNVISNAPKNDTANTTRSRKKNMLNIAFVASSFNAAAPKINVTAIPNTR